MGDKHVSDIFNDVLQLLVHKWYTLIDSVVSLVPQSNADYIACSYLVMVTGTFLYGMSFMRVEYLFQKRKKEAVLQVKQVDKGGGTGGGNTLRQRVIIAEKN